MKEKPWAPRHENRGWEKRRELPPDAKPDFTQVETGLQVRPGPGAQTAVAVCAETTKTTETSETRPPHSTEKLRTPELSARGTQGKHPPTCTALAGLGQPCPGQGGCPAEEGARRVLWGTGSSPGHG